MRKLFKGLWILVTTALVTTTILPISNANALGADNCVSTATGTLVATATQSGSNCIVIFTAGTGTWSLPIGTYSVTYLVVGGGGSSSRGICGATYGPGGGGGSVQTGTNTFSGILNVTVGNGGIAHTSSLCPNTAGNSGQNSVFQSITANGGGAGGVGKTGGTSGNGKLGGTASDSGCGECGAGGGGGAAGDGGGTANLNQGGINGLNAGPGVSSSLSGPSVEYGSGGAGRSGNYFGVARGGGGSTNNVGGSGSCSATSNTGGGGSDCGAAGWGAGGSGIVVAVYAFDVTAPTFTSSSSFSAAENIATSANAATIKVSESATVTISSGVDAGLFNIVTSDTVTAFIRFKASPNFESPSDNGGNNVYDLVLTATDLASNAGTQTITITVTDVVDTSAFNSFALGGTASFRTVVTITANVSVASRVTFRARGVIIAGCKNKLTTGSSPNIVATCSWRPSTRGAVTLTATASPTGAGISSTTAPQLSVFVGNRSGGRS